MEGRADGQTGSMAEEQRCCNSSAERSYSVQQTTERVVQGSRAYRHELRGGERAQDGRPVPSPSSASA
jgi:hypothetical protein